jgi:ABC-2 type transport system ATP-binding protein
MAPNLPTAEESHPTQSNPDWVLGYQGVTKTFPLGRGRSVCALHDITLKVERGSITGLMGPDGAGKTTLIRLAAGLLFADAGSVTTLEMDVAAHPQEVQSRVGYMPQKFGLYEDLSVQENLDLYGDLHGIRPEVRAQRYPQLMRMTGLGRFLSRLAGKLSGGMKQKLGLACTLLSSPQLLLLDEPTVGVDPVSRRDLWEIITRLVKEQGLTILVSTSYLDEAERLDQTIVLHQGKVLGAGPPRQISHEAAGLAFRAVPPARLKPRQLQARLVSTPGMIDATLDGEQVRFVSGPDASMDSDVLAGSTVHPVEPRFEDGFMVLLRRAAGNSAIVAKSSPNPSVLPASQDPHQVMVEVNDLVRQFGDFFAVKKINFRVHRGEIFGLLGPNGAGKSTTFRMLCGLLPASGGTLRVAGVNLRHARASARQHVGYVAQKFSLYGQLTVMENLEFFASAYDIWGRRKRERIDWALEQFELDSFATLESGQLPGGYKQRLAMACALMHDPEILFLDEPTSGVDPLARREFWYRINGLADQGVTVIVTTHFMEEAEYCDRMVIMVDGEILAEGTPAKIRQRGRPPEGQQPTIEDAFLTIVEDSLAAADRQAA